MEKKTLADIGELEFIERIRKSMPFDGGSIIRSAGDDCLVTEPFSEHPALFTTDTFIDGVHFTPAYASYKEIGHRCMAASVSDIAAMSGIPLYSLVSMSMPRSLLVDDAAGLFKGLSETAERYGCPACGGETTSTPGPLTVTVTIIGFAERDRLVTRNGAQVGDGIFVTGFIGDAMAGLIAFQENQADCHTLKRKFLTPEARIDISRKLTKSFRLTSMIDLSDGLASDLLHICMESEVGAVIEADRLPFSEEFQKLMNKTSRDPIEFALTAGEDYELLFTSDNDSSDTMTIPGLPLTRIGTITRRQKGITIRFSDGSQEKISKKGYEHFTT
ncbi:thiamine-phosphate kinase [Candidatus Latescibacterota bacterium]